MKGQKPTEHGSPGTTLEPCSLWQHQTMSLARKTEPLYPRLDTQMLCCICQQAQEKLLTAPQPSVHVEADKCLDISVHGGLTGQVPGPSGQGQEHWILSRISQCCTQGHAQEGHL